MRAASCGKNRRAAGIARQNRRAEGGGGGAAAEGSSTVTSAMDELDRAAATPLSLARTLSEQL